MRRKVRLSGLLAAAVLALAGCGTAGNEIMVFGTDTKVALDISGDPTGSPSFTLGYKRREAVWLPLSAGGGAIPTHLCLAGGAQLVCAAVSDAPQTGSHVCRAVEANHNAQTTDGKTKLLCVGAGEVKRSLYIGTGGGEPKDAYSVMASFGLKSEVSGQTQIAQYFATGMAARNLTESGGAALVNTTAESAEVARLSAQYRQATLEGADAVMTHVFPGGTFSETNLNKLADDTKELGALKDKLKGLKQYQGDKPRFRSELIKGFAAFLPQLSANAKAPA